MIMPFFNGNTILEILIHRLVEKFNCESITLATTENKSDDSLEKVAEKTGINCYRGDEQNVLKRFIDCADKFKAENIIRVCADNPFLDVELLSALIAFVANEKCDYASYKVNNVPAIKTHYGFFAEYVSLNALKKVARDTSDKFFQEHVTNYIYTNPDGFVIKWMDAPDLISANPDVRLTVDTKEDFEICKSIYSELESGFCYESILKLISVNPELQSKMSSQIQKNGK